jgi:signal transduction histidine kinase
VRDAIRSLWDEPRAPHPPARNQWDRALVAVLSAIAVLEVLVRPGLDWRPVAVVLGVVPVLALLWRRTDPLVAVAVAFGAHAVIHFVPIFGEDKTEALYSSALVLVLIYSLLRWGSGREATTGMAFVVASHVLTWAHHSTSVADFVFGNTVLLLPAALGASVRYRAASRVRELDQVKLREREQLARELHDTVAHHVSAIAIRAQAGRTVAAADPDAATDALAVIETEASRTLSEMRTMVGALRQGDEPDLAPQRGVGDIERLARGAGDSPTVDVRLTGRLDDLTPSVDAAIYRLAQESITNALRHSRRATLVSVSVVGGRDDVRLVVSDDGDAGTLATGTSSGYGIVGMTERATLLGGTLDAGPNPDRGWTVVAVLPRHGSAR